MGSSLATWADAQWFANDHFANVHCPLHEAFLLPLGLLQFRVGSDVDAVALVIPAGGLIDGLETFNGSAELTPHSHFGIQFVGDYHFQTACCF